MVLTNKDCNEGGILQGKSKDNERKVNHVRIDGLIGLDQYFAQLKICTTPNQTAHQSE